MLPLALSESFSVLETATASQFTSILDAIATECAARSTGVFGLFAADAIHLTDAAAIAYRLMVVDGLVAADDLFAQRAQVVAVADVLLATGIASSTLQATYLIASALAAEAVAARALRDNVTDEVAIGELVAQAMTAFHAVVESILAEDTGTLRARFTLLVDDAASLSDEALSTARMIEMLEDGVSAAVSIDLEDGRHVAWVVNAATRAAWSYGNYGFNSFAKFGDRYYGAKADGIYLLEGDTDAGAQIKASLHTAAYGFGSPNVKHLPLIYIAATRTGELVMKVCIKLEEDIHEAHWYRLEGGPASVLRQDRIKPDGGLASVEFEFELINIDGADFEIDSMRLLPALTSRRI